MVTAITRLVPPEMPATASDALAGRYSDEALRYSAMATSLLYALAALLMLLAGRRPKREFVSAPSHSSEVHPEAVGSAL